MIRKRPKTVREYLEVYSLERGHSPSASRGLLHRWNQVEKALGRVFAWADFDELIVNRLLAAEEQRIKAESVRGIRNAIQAVWNGAFEARFLKSKPERLRKIRVRLPSPKAWTLAELNKLLVVVSQLQGRMNRSDSVRRASFWKAFVLVAYYSGLRRGDMLALRWEDIDRNGVISVTMQKTGDAIQCPLPRDAVNAVGAIQERASGRPQIFGSLLNKFNCQRYFRILTRRAGLTGSVKTLRKTGASHVEAAHPGSAKAFLGHRSHGLAYRHYVDPRIVQVVKPKPPCVGRVPNREGRIGGAA